MSARFQIGLLVLFVVAAASASLFGQQAWSITGSIMTFHGDTPDRRILVTLQFRGSTIATTFSDSEGKFSFSELSPNLYRILINDEKYKPLEQLVEINSLISNPTFVRLSLVPSESPRPDTPAAGNNPNMASPVQLREFPRSALKEFDKAVKSEKDGKSDRAIEHYRKAIEFAPDLYVARNNLGSLYVSNSHFPAAQEQFEEVIKVNPNDAAAYFNMGNLCLLTQRFDDAIRWIDGGLSKEPNSAFGHFLRGSIFGRVGKTAEAEQELQKSLQLDAKMSKAHLALVNLYLQQHRSSEAISELKQFLKVAPNDPFAPKARQVLDRLQGQATAIPSNQ